MIEIVKKVVTYFFRVFGVGSEVLKRQKIAFLKVSMVFN